LSALLLDQAAARLRAAGIESPRLEARLLLAHVLDIAPETLVQPFVAADGEEAEVSERYATAVARRIAGEPLAYVIGRREFWSLDFSVGRGVLVPRPESEKLVEEAFHAFPDVNARLNVLDLGTGSGCLLLAFLSERTNARGLGIDASPDALLYARTNATALGLDNRVHFSKGDWARGVNGAFDVIFANPPYLTEAELAEAPPELRAEPRAAFAGGPDGLDAYRALAAQIGTHLNPAGRAFVEVGLGQADAVAAIFSLAGVETLRAVPDLLGIPRCLVLAATRPDGQKVIGNPKESG